MSDQVLNHFTIDIKQTLYETTTPYGKLVVYKTIQFGNALILDGQIILTENDSFIFQEMLTHPALFTHPLPKRVVIIGHPYGILQEVLKHSVLTRIDCIVQSPYLNEAISRFFPRETSSSDERVKHYLSIQEWVACNPNDPADLIMYSQKIDQFDCFKLLKNHGILVYPTNMPLLQLQPLKTTYKQLNESGFKNCQLLGFPQPSALYGWRTLIMAVKASEFKYVKEMDIYNRPFTTRFYNFDTHKAALVLPEFMREGLGL